MDLKLDPVEHQRQPLTDAIASVDGTASQELSVRQAPLSSAGQGFDDARQFKTPTVNIEIPSHLPQSASDDTGHVEMSGTAKYLQGIVQGQRAHLVTNLLDETSQSVMQPQGVWTIGRNRDVALPVRDKAMSRRHGIIHYVPGVGFYLVDLNSMNGCYVNGARIKHRMLLQDGDRIHLGNTDFTFFHSGQQRQVEALHPEVLTRLTASEPPLEHIDFLALEEPELVFRTLIRD